MTGKKMTVVRQIKVLNEVQHKVSKEISGHAARGGLYAGALAGEGYAGGYRDALSDVMLFLNGVWPDRREYWIEDDSTPC